MTRPLCFAAIKNSGRPSPARLAASQRGSFSQKISEGGKRNFSFLQEGKIRAAE